MGFEGFGSVVIPSKMMVSIRRNPQNCKIESPSSTVNGLDVCL